MQNDLTTGSVFRNVVSFSLPYLLSYFLQTLYGMDHVGKLADTGGLDQNTLGSISADNFLQGSTEITYQRAADTAGVHLFDLDTGLF